MAKLPGAYRSGGTAAPDPFRLSDMFTDLLTDAQETLYIGTTADVWEDHPGQRRVRQDEHIERWIICGNRWGKSDWGAREARYFLLGDHPFFPERLHVPAAGWAVSDTLDNSAEIVAPKLARHIPYEAIRRFPTRESKAYELTNGSRVQLKSCEQGRGAFQGADKDFIWFDDIEGRNPDLALECYQEASMRIGAGRILYKWGTMTPVCGQTNLIESLLSREAAGEISIYRGSIHDNPHLTDVAKHAALAGLVEDWQRKAREQGQITLVGGNYIFPMEVVQARCALPEPPCHYRMLVTVPIDPEDPEGPTRTKPQEVEAPDPADTYHTVWKIWAYPKPGHRYVLSVDPAGGELSENPDWTVCKVFDIDAMEEVACLRSHIGPKETAKQAMMAGLWYNVALLGVEANAVGLGVLDNSREYPRLYRRHQVNDVQPKPSQKLGWHTSEVLKEKAITDLVAVVAAGDILLRERETWREMLTFIRGNDMRLGARKGKHDDGIMCCAIGVQILMSPHLDDFLPGMTLTTEQGE